MTQKRKKFILQVPLYTVTPVETDKKNNEDTFRHTPVLYMCYGVEQNYVYIQQRRYSINV